MNRYLTGNRIFEDMKECIREAGLPVFMDPCLCDGNPNKFKSKIKINNVNIDLHGSYDTVHHFAKIKFYFDDPIDSKDIDKARQIINSVNSHLPLYHYSMCPCCNCVDLQAGLHVRDNGDFKRKFDHVLSCLLDEINKVYPLLMKTIRSGGDIRNLKEEFKNKYGANPTENVDDSGDGRKNRKINKLMKNVEQVMKKVKLIPNTAHVKDDKFMIDINYANHDNFKSRLCVFIDQSGILVLSMSPLGIIPENKIDKVMDMINRINNIFVAENLWLDCRTYDIIVMKGIVVPNLIMDRNEFEEAITHFLGHGILMLTTVLEQTISDQTPEVLISRMIEMHCDQIHDCAEKQLNQSEKGGKNNE